MKTALEIARDHKQFYGRFVDQKMNEGPKGRLLKEILDEAESASENNLIGEIEAYAREVAHAALNRAAENARIMSFPHYGDVYREVDRDSITSTEIICP